MHSYLALFRSHSVICDQEISDCMQLTPFSKVSYETKAPTKLMLILSFVGAKFESVLISTSSLEEFSSSNRILPCNSSTLCTKFLSLIFDWRTWLCSKCSTCFTTSEKHFSVIFFNWDKACENWAASVDSLLFSIASSLWPKLFIDCSSFTPNMWGCWESGTILHLDSQNEQLNWGHLCHPFDLAAI